MICPYHPTLKVDHFKFHRVADFGDIDSNTFSIDEVISQIHDKISGLIRHDVIPICVGGDHTIALPILRAMHEKHGPVAVIHCDAHLDTWEEYLGSKYIHGTWFLRAVDEGLIQRNSTYQVGLRGQIYAEDDFEFSINNGFRMVTIEELKAEGDRGIIEEFMRIEDIPVYVSFDIYCVDPAFASATGTPQIGGMDSFEAVSLVRGLKGLNIVGVDLVEVSPACDNAGITSLLATNLLYEFLCVLPTRSGS